MYCVTKAMPIHYIDSKCHIKQLKNRKSCKTCLTKHTWSISHHIMPLVINTFKGRHQTQTYQHTIQSNFKKPGVHQPHAPGLIIANLRQYLSFICNDITRKSRKQGLINKKCIATCTIIKLNLSSALKLKQNLLFCKPEA